MKLRSWSSDAAVKDVPIKLKKEERARGMEEESRWNSAVKDAIILREVLEER